MFRRYPQGDACQDLEVRADEARRAISRRSWIRDRNGNMLNFATVNNVYTITDSLGRVVTVTYNKTDANGVYDEVAFKGFGRTQRTIQVRFNSLGGSFPDGTTVLRPGYSLQSPSQLFPPVLNSSSSPFNPTRATAVVLPDGRQYRFRYNPYSELWRVDLPTGGAFEYEDGPGFGTYSTGVTGSASQQSGGELGIYRRVTERRVYPDGVTLEGKMVYTDASGSVTADHQDPSGNSLGKDQHFFSGSPLSSLLTLPSQATQHEPWKTGKEVTTKAYDKLNGPQLRQSDNTWSQSAPSWWTGSSDLAPPNNPVLTDAVSRLTDVTPNLVSKQHFGYDPQFFNQNLVEEYDFGFGSPGGKLRSTETFYVTGGNYTNPGADPTKNPNLRSLPSIVTIKDGSGVQRAQTTFEYDNYVVDAFHFTLVGRPSISGLDSGYLDPNTGTSTGTRRDQDRRNTPVRRLGRCLQEI